MKLAVVFICYVIMGWIGILLASMLEPFNGLGFIWKPPVIGWALWTLAGFVDPFFRGTKPHAPNWPSHN